MDPRIPPLPAGHDARAATFWLGFHLRRNLRKRAFKVWAALLLLVVLGLWFGGRMSPSNLGELVLGAAALMALFFGSGATREELEDQTLTYSFSRPVGRAWLYASRVLATGRPVEVLVVPLALVVGWGTGPETATRYALAALLCTVTYTALFALAGQLIKWPAWFGLAYLLFWEQTVFQVPGFLGRITVVSHVYGVAGLRPGLAAWAKAWEGPDLGPAFTALIGITIAVLWVGGQLVRRREFVVTR